MNFFKKLRKITLLFLNNLEILQKENQNIHLSKLLLIMQSCSGLVTSVDHKGIKRILAFINGYYLNQKEITISITDISFQKQQIQRLTTIETIYEKNVKENKDLTKEALQNLGHISKVQNQNLQVISPILSSSDQVSSESRSNSDGLRQLTNLFPDIDSQNLTQFLFNQSISIYNSQIIDVDNLQEQTDQVLRENWSIINSELKNVLNQIQSSKLFGVANMHLKHILRIYQAITIQLNNINIEYFYIEDRCINACTLCDATIIINLSCFNLWKLNHQKELDFDIIKGFIAFVVLMILHEYSHILNKLGHQKWEFNTILMKKQIQSYCNIDLYEAGEIFEKLLFNKLYDVRKNILDLPYQTLVKVLDIETYQNLNFSFNLKYTFDVSNQSTSKSYRKPKFPIQRKILTQLTSYQQISKDSQSYSQ